MTTTTKKTPLARFDLGQIVMTAAVDQWLQETEQTALVFLPLLGRHVRADWGDICQEDQQANDAALRDGDRILSAYHLSGRKLWVITEWDRSLTTILFPEDY